MVNLAFRTLKAAIAQDPELEYREGLLKVAVPPMEEAGVPSGLVSKLKIAFILRKKDGKILHIVSGTNHISAGDYAKFQSADPLLLAQTWGSAVVLVSVARLVDPNRVIDTST